jgi:hypothetical protein
MDNLNNIPNAGNWGDAASKLNDNFNKVKQAVTTIENTSINNKGYFASLSALNTAFPNPKAGQTAYVYSEASSTKYYIYNAFNGGWVTASVEAPSIGVDIAEYTKTGGSTKTTKEVEDDLAQLAGEVDGIGIETKRGVPDLSISDEQGNDIVRFEDGHIKTKNFNSDAVKISVQENPISDLSISDEQGNDIVRFEDGHIKTKNFNSKNIGAKKTINILSIGNSYSRDSLPYVPYILKNINPDLAVNIGILYYGGCSLQQHDEFIHDGSTVYEYNEYNGGNSWSLPVTGKSIGYAINKREWDIVLLQQKSSDSVNYATFQPHLDNIVSWLTDNLNYNFKIGWLMTHAYAPGYAGLSSLGMTSDEMALASSQNAHNVVSDTVVDFFIPYGIAIQNARKTSLNSIANSLTYEGTHLNEGIPVLIAGYTIAQTIDNLFFHSGKSILGDQLRPSAQWISEIKVADPHGDVLGVSNENCFLAQKCALMAIKKTNVITNI